MNQIWLALVTGLTTGGISCFAVQGGLLTSALANQDPKIQKRSITYFLGSKILAYTVLGILLGLLGSTLTISPKLQGFMQILAGIFMLLTVGRILDLHPIFRTFVITPPKAFYRILRIQTKKEGFFAPAVLGFLTVLIPCGITQAMMLLAIASGNPIEGGLILSAFTLGTSPIFFALGVASGELLKRRSLSYIAALAIFVLGILSINTGQVLNGSSHTLQNYWAVLVGESKNPKKVAGVDAEGKQEITINVTSSGYKTSSSTLKAGVPAKLSLVTNNVQGCVRGFNIPSLGISRVLPATGTETLEFTPTKTGRLAFSCSMGMYTGYFEII